MLDELRTFGRVWMPRKPGDLAKGLVTTPALEAELDEIEGRLKGRSPRSVLICGEPGTGKTALCQLLAARLVAAGWLVFEAGAGEVLAGQKYIGQLEGRISQIVVALNGKRQLWLVPAFHELLWAGMWSKSPTGALDTLLPHVERGTLQIVGELPVAAYEHLVRERPAVRRVFVVHRLAPHGATTRPPAAVAEIPGPLRIVRRYRADPSPLVKDNVRGWRTGPAGGGPQRRLRPARVADG